MVVALPVIIRDTLVKFVCINPFIFQVRLSLLQGKHSEKLHLTHFICMFLEKCGHILNNSPKALLLRQTVASKNTLVLVKSRGVRTSYITVVWLEQYLDELLLIYSRLFFDCSI